MTEGRVGPNAILQTIEALTDTGGMDLTRRMFGAAGLLPLLEAPPQEMVPEDWALSLHRTIVAELPPEDAEWVAVDAGCRTGRYILDNRIPAIVRKLLRVLPARLSGRVLLRAIEKHAWTFAGSAEVSVKNDAPMVFTIHRNPLSIPGCPWHRAVFETLFQELVSPRARVSHRFCCGNGGGACVFEIDIWRGA